MSANRGNKTSICKKPTSRIRPAIRGVSQTVRKVIRATCEENKDVPSGRKVIRATCEENKDSPSSISKLETLTEALIILVTRFLTPCDHHALVLTAKTFKVAYNVPLWFMNKDFDVKIIPIIFSQTKFKIAGLKLEFYDTDTLQIPSSLYSTIRELQLHGCGTISHDIVKHFSNLEVFSFLNHDWYLPYNMNVLQFCSKLRKLSLVGCRLETNMPTLTNLECLYFKDVSFPNFEALKGWPKLRRLELIRCSLSANLESLAYLSQLETLNLECTSISNLNSLVQCTNLTYLSFDQSLVRDDLNLKPLPQLCTLGLDTCSSLTWMPMLSRLHTLNISGNGGLSSLEGIGNAPNITSLQISECKRLPSLMGLRACSRLTHLELADFSDGPSLPEPLTLNLNELKECPSIKELHFSNINVKYKLKECHHLTDLHIDSCRVDSTLISLEHASNLTRLQIINPAFPSHAIELKACTQLKILNIKCRSEICLPISLMDLINLRKIKFLISSRQIQDYTWIYTSSSVSTIHLRGTNEADLEKIRSLPPVEHVGKLTLSQSQNLFLDALTNVFTHIHTLYLKVWKEVRQLGSLANLVHLQYLRLVDCVIVDLSGLDKCTSLDTLTLFKCKKSNGDKNIPIIDFSVRECNNRGGLIASIKRLDEPLREQLLWLCFKQA